MFGVYAPNIFIFIGFCFWDIVVISIIPKESIMLFPAIPLTVYNLLSVLFNFRNESGKNKFLLLVIDIVAPSSSNAISFVILLLFGVILLMAKSLLFIAGIGGFGCHWVSEVVVLNCGIWSPSNFGISS